MKTTEASSDRITPDRRRRATVAAAAGAVVTGAAAAALAGTHVLALLSLNHNETIIRSRR